MDVVARGSDRDQLGMGTLRLFPCWRRCPPQKSPSDVLLSRGWTPPGVNNLVGVPRAIPLLSLIVLGFRFSQARLSQSHLLDRKNRTGLRLAGGDH